MNEEQRRILNMLAEGKITAREAEALLEASEPKAATSMLTESARANPRYLRVLVEGHDGEHSGKVNLRVPFNLLRAGVRLAALLPSVAYEPVNRALKDSGVDIDISKVKPKDLEDLVQHLSELSVDVDGNNGEKVRVYCE